jgi:hypothetical protein
MKRQDLLSTEDHLHKALIKYGTLEGALNPDIVRLLIIEEYDKQPSPGRTGTDKAYAIALRAPKDGGRATREELKAIREALGTMFRANGLGPDPRSLTGDSAPSPFGKDKVPVVAIYPVVGLNRLEDVNAHVDGYYKALESTYRHLTQPDERPLIDMLVRAIGGKPIRHCSRDDRIDDVADTSYERLEVNGDDAKQIASDIVKQMTQSGYAATLEGTDDRAVIEVPVEYRTHNGVFQKTSGLIEAFRGSYAHLFARVEKEAREIKAARYKIRLPEIPR